MSRKVFLCCEIPTFMEVKQYGAAVTECFIEESGKMFVENGEYENQVLFCPFCGKTPLEALKLKLKKGKWSVFS